MKILMVTPMPPQPQAPGAIPLVLYAELMGLLPRHQVTLLTVAGHEPGEHDAIERLLSAGIDVRAIRRTEPVGIKRWQRRWRLASLWLGGKLPWRTVWFWEPGVQHLLDDLLAKEAFDLVIVEDNAMGAYTYKTSLPLLFTEHEVRRPRLIDSSALRRGDFYRWMLKESDWARWTGYQRSVWQRFDRIQVFTRRDADAIARISPELASRVRVNPFGIQLPDALDASAEQQDTLLFTGNYTHAPNVDAALWLGMEFMPRLRAVRSGIKLWLVGIYPPHEVKALACDDILVTGPVPDIEPYFARAALVVAPLHIGGGMRMKVLQAMALGKAVLTTSRGADGLTLNGHQPPLVTADDPTAFSAAILRLLSDEFTRHQLGMNAHSYVADNFSSHAYANRIEVIYAEMQKEKK